MDPGLLDMLQDPRDRDVLAVADRIDIDLDRVAQIAVDQHRRGARHLDRGGDVMVELLGPVDHFHRPPAKHVARAQQHRIADPARDHDRLVAAPRKAVLGLACSFNLSTSLAKRSRSSARSMLSGLVPRIVYPAAWISSASLSGVCPPSWTITPSSSPLLALAVEDFEHVLAGQRLEIEPVRRVGVGRHRLGIAIDHDRLKAPLPSARRRRGSSNNRTRSPARCGSARRRG